MHEPFLLWHFVDADFAADHLPAMQEGVEGGTAPMDATKEDDMSAAKPAPKTRSAAAAVPAEPEAAPVERPPAEALAGWQLACHAWLQHVRELLNTGTAKVRSRSDNIAS